MVMRMVQPMKERKIEKEWKGGPSTEWKSFVILKKNNGRIL
jgi:hypothetical protein